MIKQNTKIFSLILSLIIILCTVSTNAYAVAKTTFAVESVTKQEFSSTVNVNITVQNNVGIAGATLNLDFADGLTLISVTNGAAFSNLVLTPPGTFTNQCRFLWDSVEGEATENGVILTLTFDVANDATGDLGIEIYCNDGDVYNKKLDTVEVQTVNGVVKTSSQSTDTPECTEPTFEVKSATKLNASSTVNIDIVVKNNPGIAGATLNIDYAEGLTLVDAVNGAAFSNLVLTPPGTFTNQCRFLWDSVEGEATENGVILTLIFEVANDATGDLGVEIYCNDGDVYNKKLDTVEVQTVNGVVKTSSQSSDTPESTEPIFEVVSTVKSESSSTVDVNILVKNNPGIAGATLNVSYSDKLTLISASNGNAFSKLTLTVPGQYSNPSRFLWDSIDGEATENGVILSLTFEVASDATGDLNIEISCNDGDVYNEKLDTVIMIIKSGVVLVSERDNLFIKNGSTAEVDYSTGIITGLQPNLISLNEYLFVREGYESEYDKTIGTGCKINIKQSNIIVETYTIVIFGDANGDSVYDGMDAVTVSMIAAGMLTREQVGEAVYMAADCNHDGAIDELDVELLEEAGLLLASIDQSKSGEELQTDSVYVEYLNLIEQNPANDETNSEKQDNANDETGNSQNTKIADNDNGENNNPQPRTNSIIGFIADIYAFLNNIINFIKMLFA